MTAGGVAPESVVTVVDQGSRRDIEVRDPQGRPHARDFPVPSLEPRGLSPLDVEVLHTDGVTADNPDERWHVKIYRCPTPETAVELEELLRAQADLVRTANAAYANNFPRDRCPWAVAPCSVAIHGDSREAVTGTRYGATPEEVRSHPSARIAGWFDGESIQPERCIVVVSPFLDATEWRHGGRLALHELRHFDSMAKGLDALHEIGAAHCDVKPSNVRRTDRRAARRYVLVDGDSVVGLSSAPDARQLRHTTLPPAVRTALQDGRQLNEAQLREIDRFGFVMVVLAGLTDPEWVRQFLDRPEPEHVRAQLLLRGAPPDMADVFAEVLRRDALSTPGWTAQGWLEHLRMVAGRQISAIDGPEASEVSDSKVEWRHAADIVELEQRLGEWGPLTARDAQPALLQAMDAQAKEVRRRAKHRLLWWVSTVCLVAVVIAAVWSWQVS